MTTSIVHTISIALSFFILTSFVGKDTTIGKQNYGLVIGISDYQDDAIPDLQFAHRDAEAYANYLVNTHSYKVPLENLNLITNHEATGGRIHKALGELLSKAQKRDRVFIYFAGHGDVESIDEKDHGHLLLYDTPANTYQVNSLRLDDLKTIISKLTNEIGAEVVLIADACHSGKLAGQEIQGAQITNNVLAGQFAGETKILSCGPNEYSQEGMQWGNGRGVFSFNLIEGLTGLADNNGDSQITGRELQRYLEDKVEEAVNPEIQTPEFIGDRRKAINFVDEDALVKLLENKSSEADYEEFSIALQQVAESQNDGINLVREAFYVALQEGYFIPADIDQHANPNQQSASEIYDNQLTDQLSENQIKGIKADFIAALQDDAQSAINSYLNATNEIILDYEFGKGEAYKNYPKYLEKAASLLGSDHYLYTQMLAKMHFFQAVYYRLSSLDVEDISGNYDLAYEELQKAILYDDKAAYIYCELGRIYAYRTDDKSISMYERAIELSPNWPIPYSNIAVVNHQNKKYKEAERYAQMAIDLDDKYVRAYYVLSQVYRVTEQKQKGKTLLQEFINSHGENYFIYSILGEHEYLDGNYEQAIEFLDKSNEIIPNYQTHFYLGLCYYGNDDVLAQSHWEEALALYPTSFDIMNNLGWIHQTKKEHEIAKNYYKKALEIKSDFLSPRFNLAKIQFEESNYKASKSNLEYIISQLDKNHEGSLVHLSKIAYLDKELALAAKYYKRLIESGSMSKEDLDKDEFISKMVADQQFATHLK